MNQDPKSKIDEGKQEQLALFSKPESHFVFKGPQTLEIKSAVKGQKNYCTLDEEKWAWQYGGVNYSIDWSFSEIPKSLIEILKTFIFHRLRAISPKTVATCDCRWISYLKANKLKHTFPWQSQQEIRDILADITKTPDVFYGFKAMYKFAYSRG